MAVLPVTAHSLPYGSGAQLYIGFVAEVLPGIPSDVTTSPLSYIAVEADQVSFSFDPGRTVLELASGDLYTDYVQVEYEAKGTGSFDFPVFPTGTVYNLLTLCGLANAAGGALAADGTGTAGTAGPIGITQYITFYVGRVLAEEIYAGCRCKMITFTSTSQKPLMCKLDFAFIARPVVAVFVTGSGYVAPASDPYNPALTSHALGAGFHEGGLQQPTWPTSYTGGGAQLTPYMWTGLQQVDLLAATNVGSPTFTASVAGPYLTQTGVAYDYDLPTPVSALSDIEITITFNLIEFYGNHQNNLPSHLIPGAISVSGKFSRLFTDFAEYNLYNEVCSRTGPLNFIWTSGCLGTGHDSFTLLIPAAFYKKQDFKNPQKGAITEDYEWGSIKDHATSTGSPLLYTNNYLSGT